MEVLQIRPQNNPPSPLNAMSIIKTRKIRPRVFSACARALKSGTPNDEHTSTSKSTTCCRNTNKKNGVGALRVSEAQLKQNWLTSLSCPFPAKTVNNAAPEDLPQRNVATEWVLGVDPDLSGALALLKTDHSGCSAQVFDSPYLKVLVGKRIRRRLDAKSIVQLLQSLNVPIGTTAYVEQSSPYPQDGKQGWWSGGFGYGLWIGILVASGLSVVPVPSPTWKNEFELSGGLSNKDESRKIASMLFPSLSQLFKRKKDHGRAEALLIAAYGRNFKVMGTVCTCEN